jgi:hypothetical protein
VFPHAHIECHAAIRCNDRHVGRHVVDSVKGRPAHTHFEMVHTDGFTSVVKVRSATFVLFLVLLLLLLRYVVQHRVTGHFVLCLSAYTNLTL